ncbi:thioredoxin domain-containing protein [Streptomyces aurantiacus]|uniref:Putative Disulfide bond formation protein D n=1 Tax=Streptomyces aurantiacus JA 4570 TaxID=1286094 RepID=S4ASZ2_9ACTN|nr:thioredoxin domain-containing protein [Streptomyces aurantiacus]EPH44517.1 putative Disulfide bond formation protein D [Streptomyces aurantiacus JA 4570]
MSEKNREGKRTARERLAEERERQKARDKQRRVILVSAAVVGVLALAAVGGLLAANAGDDDNKKETAGPVVAPKGASGDDKLAIPLGKDSAKSRLTVWEDFRCPACKQFEDGYSSTINELAAKGQLKAEYHLATLIDGNMGGSGSLHAANAAACAQDAGKFAPYHDELFKNQPPEPDDAFADNGKLIDLAGKVDGLVTDTFKKCVNDGEHNSWVAKSQEAFGKANLRGTPTVLLDGKDIFADQRNPVTPQKLKAMVEKANQ